MSTKTEIRKALDTSATNGGNNLLPYDLDPVLYEELLKLSPLAQMLDVIEAGSKTHEYTVRSSHPFAWFEGESTPANPSGSSFQRKSVQVKIQRIWGSVTGFAQSMDERFIDALATELEGSLEGAANLMEYSTIWGASNDVGFSGDAFQYSGILPRIFAYAPGNVIDAAGAKVTLDMLDQALSKVTYRGTQNDVRSWFMGVRMKQIVDGLQTKVQIPLTQVQLADGKLVMAAYGRAGIFETDYVVPDATSTSPSNLAGTGAAGGSLTASTTYNYRIASVNKFGEQVAAANVTASTAAGQGTINLTFTADPSALLYMIFRGASSTTHGLVDIIAAKTYDANGTVNGTVSTYSDTGVKPVISQVKPLNAGEQNIVLANFNARRGASLIGKIDDMGRPLDNLWSFVELARTKDTFDYMLKSYNALRIIYPNLFSVVRGVKTS